MSTPDKFIPKPLILCPISAHKINFWHGVDMPHRGLEWTEKSPSPKSIEDTTETAPAEPISAGDFQIRTMSPDPVQEHIQITVHCFVSEGVWVSSEVCEVLNTKTGMVIYSTEEDAVRRAIIEHHEKKRKKLAEET